MQAFVAGLDFDEFWTYEGSATSPSCGENVNWMIPRKVRSVSEEQLKRFKDVLALDPLVKAGGGNNRATQRLNERILYTKGFDHSKDSASTLMTFLSTAAVGLAALAF